MKKKLPAILALLSATILSSSASAQVAPNMYTDQNGLHITANAAQNVFATVPNICQLRLYPTSGSPYAMTSSTSSTICIGGSTQGNQCAFQQTNGSYLLLSVPEIVISLSGLTALTGYDVYLKDINGVTTYSMVAWSSLTTAPTRSKDSLGRWTKSSDTTSLLIGAFEAPTTTTCIKTPLCDWVSSVYNTQDDALTASNVFAPYGSGNISTFTVLPVPVDMFANVNGDATAGFTLTTQLTLDGTAVAVSSTYGISAAATIYANNNGRWIAPALVGYHYWGNTSISSNGAVASAYLAGTSPQ